MARRDRGGEALEAYAALQRAAGCLSGRVQRRLARHGLTSSQFGALEALHRHGPLCHRDIGRRLAQTGGNVTMVVRNLERRGLVERRRDAANRRFVTVQLTPRGRRLIADLRPRHAQAVAAEMRALGGGQCRILEKLCELLESPGS